MTLAPDWKLILRKTWSIRWLVLAAALTGAEVLLPFFATDMPNGLFAALSCLAIVGAFVARLLAQKDLP